MSENFVISAEIRDGIPEIRVQPPLPDEYKIAVGSITFGSVKVGKYILANSIVDSTEEGEDAHTLIKIDRRRFSTRHRMELDYVRTAGRIKGVLQKHAEKNDLHDTFSFRD